MNTAAYNYVGFGVSVRSNWPLPGLRQGSRPGRTVDVEFHEPAEDRVDPGLGPPAASAGLETLWHLADGSWLVRHVHPRLDAVWTMQIAERGERVDVRWTEGAPKDDVVAVVQGAGIGASLNRMGEPVLHACAVDVGGQAIVVIGSPGAGKSTTAAAFVAAGYAVMADDIAAMEIDPARGPVVHSGPSRMRLEPQTARALGWDPDTLRPVYSSGLGREKRYVNLSTDEGSFCPESRPVARLCLLEARGGDHPMVEPVSSAAALPWLVENTYAARLWDGAAREEQFHRYVELVQSIPVRRVHAPDALEDAGQMVAALVADLE